MFRVSKNGEGFYVSEKEKALQYAKDGYDVKKEVVMKLNDKGELEEVVDGKKSVTGGIVNHKERVE